MRIERLVLSCALAACLGLGATTASLGQGGLPEVVPPPQEFKTAEEHYNFLLKLADGGTEHTWESVPKWEGLWSGDGNTIVQGGTFVAGVTGGALAAGGTVQEDVLTPPYEEQFKARRTEMLKYKEQPYDRLTHCEPPGYPRWLLEPYVREFVNTPNQSWWMNDLMNETRRVYIGQEHKNIFGTHSWLGDTIGFWMGDKLVTWTKDVLPADYFRGQPLTSNRLESVEVWELKTYDNGNRRLEVQITFYDPHALTKPLSAAYTYRRRTDLEEAGARIYHWECALTSNSYRTADGNTNYFLPGEPGYKDARGTTEFSDLPGQSRDPIYGEEKDEVTAQH